MQYSGGGSSVVRRFRGRIADEVAVRWSPGRVQGDVVPAFERAYRDLAGTLRGLGGSLDDVECETVYFRRIARDLPALVETRRHLYEALGCSAGAPPLACIGQAPLQASADFELAVTAFVPHSRSPREIRDVDLSMSCPCTGCRLAGGRLIRVGTQTVLHGAILYGAGADCGEQARNMFEAAERLLAACGMGVGDVVRTWIYLRDIDRDYPVLNAARRAFFGRHGIVLRPASTGVQGTPPDGRHACGVRLLAIRADGGLERSGISVPCLNEAWTYGADFSRGLDVRDANKRALYISGTASIDAAGRTAHPGNFTAQARRMLDNIAALLGCRGATFDDLLSAVAYVRSPEDAQALRMAFEGHGLVGVPCVMVATPLCRPDLLCETEVTAALP